jgi:hypothetical protein
LDQSSHVVRLGRFDALLGEKRLQEFFNKLLAVKANAVSRASIAAQQYFHRPPIALSFTSPLADGFTRLIAHK